MGDEVSKRTKAAFSAGMQQIHSRLDNSLEAEKDKNDFLNGVPDIVEALKSGKITCRVYRKDKFHAKCYLTHARQEVIGSFALVGSSNFTYPGLTENIELNVQISGTPVTVLQEWYEQHWEEAEDVTPEILQTVERHIHEYTPFEVYVKSIQEYCRGHQLTTSEWELAGAPRGSRMYSILDQYQQEGYQSLMKIAAVHKGAFLCDGVGLGKTFVGLMVIERLILHEGKRVALFVPKTGRVDVWERAIRDYLPHIGGIHGGDFSSLVIFNHTDLGRGGEFPYRLERIKEMADAIIIDEAHHFRNLGRKAECGGKPSRYYQLFDLIDGPRGPKDVFLLTATPINNSLHDFRHMAELFTRGQDDALAKWGVHSLRGHFVGLEKKLLQDMHLKAEEVQLSLFDAEELLTTDIVFRELVVQRSRAYVRQSQLQQGGNVATFPDRQPPQVAEYSVKKTYGALLELVDKAFQKEKPLFVLGIYYPLAYCAPDDKDVDPWEENRQKAVCGLIRTQFLKRFESSAHSFEQSCNRLLLKLLAWTMRHSETPDEKRRLERWQQQNADLIGYVHERQLELFGEGESDEDADEDLITPEMLEDVVLLDREKFDVHKMLEDTRDDMNQVAEFLKELKKFKPSHDDKLKALIKLLKTDPVMKKYKVLIFSEFAETARYLKRQLVEEGIDGVEQIDSGSKKDRAEVIRRFAPYYNGASTSELNQQGHDEIRILISTDVLSEGLNLQDCTRLINYDLHWNPVRLMQRIGRVDRRMNPKIEIRMIDDHSDYLTLRGHIAFWNFLPPDELNVLLSLYNNVAHKTLKISRTLGIEGQKLLTPEDDYEALRDFNEKYEGQTTSDEQIRLELQKLLGDDPTLAARLDQLPGRVFSGKQHPTPGTRAVFFCYRLPRPDHSQTAKGDIPWTEEAGETRWYLHRISDQRLVEEPSAIIEAIRCISETPRHCEVPQPTLADIRLKIEKHIKNTWLKRMQAPIGVKPLLKAWMELN